jgi:signal transduction histidine kinase
VKSITELHGGSVSVRSSIKGPTTFTASFPAHPTPQDVIR